ncbi:TetR/AcrR family transcriptional regulator [Xylophilus sp. GOD-11R]|uniref:TetR/AcrR family transcriptional regulator n=1 Tax=Xylophilus sp. GOD-11R TaxID=3089814 RepID=UPI00298BF934|nr:TetR/AcrR family transcriptional regulator [Xylophilus sp. GOD-11R]WPB56957.1 TetR/AcrR family transcriptional regulator [Xylophilus sp. GOD-11R]
MKVSKEQMALNRERILDAAAEAFRERGFDGIGVADLMDRAGLTHGGFYGHFASKEELMAAAAQRAAAQIDQRWGAMPGSVEPAPAARRAEIAGQYLSSRHRDARGQGCVVAALGGDAARQAEPVRRAFGEGIRAAAGRLEAISPGKTAAARRARALGDYATMVGAMVLARAVDDDALSDEILAAARLRLGLEAEGVTGAG